MTQRIVESRGVKLAVYESGTEHPITLVFVHGYPDDHTVWDGVIEALEGTYHCVSYDVRGAGASDAPSDLSGYDMEELSRDLGRVLDAVSPNAPVHLIGHDWGSIQSWESVTTDRLRGRIASFTSISGPCLDHVGHLLRSQLRERSLASFRAIGSQLAKSWYIGMFHVPGLAERAWSSGTLSKRFPEVLLHTEGVRARVHPGRDRDGSRGVGLYRANMRPRITNPGHRRANVPVQLIVPTQDRYVGADLFQEVARWVPDLERHDVSAGHWFVLSDPKRAAGLVDAYVRRIEARSARAA